MRRALIVGIDEYPGAPLRGCVGDAASISRLLAKHEDGTPNFDCRVVTAPQQRITRASLRRDIETLFEQRADVALLYFAGHGVVNSLGGYLVTQDAETYDAGVAMNEILALASGARRIEEVVIILDCCGSGAFGALPAIGEEAAWLREGLAVLTASRANQPAMESGSGIFTRLVCAALNGGAADVLGDVTIASIYAFVDQTLGAWKQRPLFKAHVSNLIALRYCKPSVPVEALRKLPRYFPTPESSFQLDPSFERSKGDPAYAQIAVPSDPAHEGIFQDLQQFRSARLLLPVGEEHLYYAAMNRGSCILTPLGEFYWHLANEGKI